LVVLNVRPDHPPPENLRKHLIGYDKIGKTVVIEAITPGLSFVKVWLGAPNDKQKRSLSTTSGGLWLITHGFDAIGLASTTIRLPAEIWPNPVATLNHAYTRLSELFEPW
jgi:hypothetical protein